MLKGILASLAANVLFGAVYYFAILLRPLEGEAMFGFRIVVVIPFILLAIILFKQQSAFADLLQKIRQNPPLVLVILLLALNTGVQLWLFLWAPNHGQALQVSFGYLLLPIVAVALGKMVFKEHFTRLKWLSLLFAVIGVGSSLFFNSTISWATWVAGLGYPLYITLRRYFQINTLATFFCGVVTGITRCTLLSQPSGNDANSGRKSANLFLPRIAGAGKWQCFYSLYPLEQFITD